MRRFLDKWVSPTAIVVEQLRDFDQDFTTNQYLIGSGFSPAS